jgi:hypothetical protein
VQTTFFSNTVSQAPQGPNIFKRYYFSISFIQQYRAIATFQGNSTSEAYFLKRVFDTGPGRLASFYYVAAVSAYAWQTPDDLAAGFARHPASKDSH